MSNPTINSSSIKKIIKAFGKVFKKQHIDNLVWYSDFVVERLFEGFIAPQKLSPKEVVNFKRRARKLFSKAFGLNFLAGISTIRLKFPEFHGNLKPLQEGDATPFYEWADLIDNCLIIIDKKEWAEKLEALEANAEQELKQLQTLSPSAQMEALARRHSQIQLFGKETFMGASYKVNRIDNNGKLGSYLGKWGYNPNQEYWFFMLSTGQVRRFSSSLVVWNFILDKANLQESDLSVAA